MAPTEFEGTTWIVSGTVANEAVTVGLVDSEASMTITDDQAQIDTGCNTGSSAVEVTDTTITFGPVAMTMMACDEELTRLEASVVLALDGEVTYEINGDTLSIRKADGRSVSTSPPSPDPPRPIATPVSLDAPRPR